MPRFLRHGLGHVYMAKPNMFMTPLSGGLVALYTGWYALNYYASIHRGYLVRTNAVDASLSPLSFPLSHIPYITLTSAPCRA
jgi:hypothetical protein